LEIKIPFSQIKNTVEGHSTIIEQVGDGISELRDKIEIKEKTKEILVKQLKSCERNMQELSDSIKSPNLRIMGIEEEEVQVKKIHNIFNKIMRENFPNLEKVLPIQVQEASRTPNRLGQNKNLPTAYHHQNNKHREQRKNIEGYKRKKQKKTNNIKVNPSK
jgi:septal ring factor EnvC (AmiA/AmiB activator)